MFRLLTPPTAAHSPLGRIWPPSWIAEALLVALVARSAFAQSAPVAKDQVLPPMEIVALTTKDHVNVHCLYFAGTRQKETVPVILLHGWEGPRGPGSSADCAQLALQLQRQGHAVVVPDLRGHGQSVNRRWPDGRVETIDRDDLRPVDFRDMEHDVEAVKSFLMKKNNAGELNIELLCVVGFDMSAVVALNWVHYDWSVPPLPTIKQGQDVKAFVLVSPGQSFRGLPLRPALADDKVRSDLSCMIVFGRQAGEIATSGRRLFNSFKRSHRPIPEDAVERKQKQDLFLLELETSLQGTKLLSSPALNLADEIQRFIEWRLVNKRANYPWQDRTLP